MILFIQQRERRIYSPVLESVNGMLSVITIWCKCVLRDLAPSVFLSLSLSFGPKLKRDSSQLPRQLIAFSHMEGEQN